MRNEKGFSSGGERGEGGLDKRIDLEAEILELQTQLHEAEFPSGGEPDENKAQELRARIEKLKVQQAQIESEEVQT